MIEQVHGSKSIQCHVGLNEFRLEFGTLFWAQFTWIMYLNPFTHKNTMTFAEFSGKK